MTLLIAFGLSVLVTPHAVANANPKRNANGSFALPPAGVRQRPLAPAVVPTTELPLKLTSNNPSQGENFARAIALSADGKTMVIGAFNENGAGGSAYIFEQSGGAWNQVKKLSGGTNENDWFGVAVDISADTVVIGASRYNNGSNSNAGAIYIFARDQGGSNNWGLVQKRLALDADAGDSFGYSVALEGDLIVVGARFDDERAASAGAIYLFGRNQGGFNNWGQITKKTADDGSKNDYLGEGVALQGDLIAVRAHKTVASGTLGAVYLFARNQGGLDNWGQSKKFDVGVADANTQNQYNYPLALNGDLIVVGAYQMDLRGVDSGAAYIFARNQGGTDNWGLVQTLFAEDTDAGDSFGRSVVIDGDYILVGAQGESTLAAGAGAAYLFVRNQSVPNQWDLLTKFVAPVVDANIDDNLGRAALLRNQLVVVGASVDDNNGLIDDGALYLYELNPGAPTVQWSAATYTAAENSGVATIQVTLSAAAPTDVTVNYATSNGTASAPGDYTASSGVLTFNPGETSKSITIPIINDNLTETDETLNLTLSSPSNATLGLVTGATLTIVDDDLPTVQLSSANYNTAENSGAALMQVTLSAASSKVVTVNYATSNGTASAPDDYTTTNGTLTFNPGETSKNINVPIVNDNVAESNETLNLVLSNPANATLGTPVSASLTIFDGERLTVQLSATSYTVNENSGVATILVTLSSASATPVTINYSTSDGTASAGSDYSATSGTLTFDVNKTSASFSVPILNDNALEADETINLILSSPTNSLLGTPFGATLTIRDDDLPTVQFSVASPSISERGDVATLQVVLNAPSAEKVMVDYATSNDTATAGEDYTASSGTLTFQPGEVSKGFSLPVLNDNLHEADETVNLILSNPVNAILGATCCIKLQIVDDDPAPTPTPTATPVLPTPGAVYLALISNAPPPTPTPTWQRFGGDGLHVTSLAIQGAQLFAGVRDNNGGLYRRDLANCSATLGLNRVNMVNANTVLDVKFFGSQLHGVLAAYDQGIFYTADGGATWTRSPSQLLKDPRTVALASAAVVYAGAEEDGIYRSEDGGANWERQTTNPKLINRIKLDAFDSSSLWIGTEGAGVWKLTVGINRLVEYNQGLSNAGKQVWDFAFNEEQIYLATFNGVFVGNGVDSWLPVGTALGGREIYSIAIVDDQFYAGAHNAGVWQRLHPGGDWSQLASPGGNNATVSELLSVANGPCPGLLAATNDGIWIYR